MTYGKHATSRLGVGVFVLAAALTLVPGSDPYAEEAAKADGVRTLYLIRHGEYDHADPRDPDIGKGLVPRTSTRSSAAP